MKNTAKKVLLVLVPLAASASAFLILFNNFHWGRLILVILVLLNLGYIPALSRVVDDPRERRPGMLASTYTIAAAAGWLLVELLFPVLAPKDYANVLNLSRTFFSSEETGGSDTLVFDNREFGGTLNAIPSPRHEKTVRWHVPGEKYVYHGYDPNMGLGYINIVYWNSAGHYDFERNLAKSSNTYRIVVIGDSFVEAVQVPLARTFHKLLETSLNSSLGSGVDRKIEVIALGNSGAGQRKNRDVLVNSGLSYNPDMVLVTLYANDFCDDDPELSKEMGLSAGLPGNEFRRLVLHGYYALAFVFNRLDERKREKIAVNPELLQWCSDYIPRVEVAWNKTLEAVKASRDVCREKGIEFVLIYLGSELELKHELDPVGTIDRLKKASAASACSSWEMDKSLRRVASYCAEHNIQFVSMLDSLVSAQKATGREIFADHYTMFGHQVVARTLFCALRSLIHPAFQPISWRDDCATPETFEPAYDPRQKLQK